MADGKVITSVAGYLRRIAESGVPVKFGVIFGSQAKGTSDAWSDIDLIVVSSLFDGQRTREQVNMLWRLAARVDSRIEPIPCGERQWEKDDESSIIEIARREGFMVNPFEHMLNP
jgi:predicted nucleotidyltransferase